MTVAIGLALAQAFGEIKKGQMQESMWDARATGLEAQSKYTRFTAKQESLKHKKAAAATLQITLQRMASANALAGKGFVKSDSGNPTGVLRKSLNVGGTDFAMAKSNEDNTMFLGQAQAEQQLYQAARSRQAGKYAKRTSMASAVFTIAKAGYDFYKTQPAPVTVPKPGGSGGSGSPQLAPWPPRLGSYG